jgi:hypothetical protein
MPFTNYLNLIKKLKYEGAAKFALCKRFFQAAAPLIVPNSYLNGARIDTAREVAYSVSSHLDLGGEFPVNRRRRSLLLLPRRRATLHDSRHLFACWSLFLLQRTSDQ